MEIQKRIINIVKGSPKGYNTYENSVDLLESHFASTAFKTAVGTGYSLIKFPRTNFTFFVTPRLIVCLFLQAVSVPADELDTVEIGLGKGSP